MTVVGALFSTVFSKVDKVLSDRYKRPTPNYEFEFEKEVQCYGYGAVLGVYDPRSEDLKNYVSIKNSDTVPLHDLTTKVYFNNKKERRDFQIMEIADNLFDLEVEHLLAHSHTNRQHNPARSKNGVIREKREQGFFIPDSAMEKLKRLSPIKVEVEYTWEGKKGSDIWLFDFSDENEVRFGMSSPTFWQKIKLIFKRIF